MALSVTQIATRLYKKLFGKAETSPARDFFEEPFNAPTSILTSQIWAQSDQIPLTASAFSASGHIIGVVQFISGATLTAVAGTSNSFQSNELRNAIPFNFGPSGSYNYALAGNNNVSIPFGTNDWLLDTEGGVVTFYNGVPANVPPKVTFYKYVGATGFASASVSTAISSSYALTASYAANSSAGTPESSSWASSSLSSSYSFTASYALNATPTVSASWASQSLSSSWAPIQVSSSYATTASWAKYADRALSSSYADTAGAAGGGLTGAGISNYVAKFSSPANLTTSNITDDTTRVRILSSADITGSLEVSASVTASQFKGAGSQITGIISSSYAVTSSYSTQQKPILLALCNNQPANTVIGSIAASLVEHDSADRIRFDLSQYPQVQLVTQVVTPASASVAAQWSLDQVTWDYFDGVASPSCSLVSTGLVVSQWVTIVSQSRTDVFIRWVSVNGDNTSSPAIRYIQLGVR
jgi:hypothetical protein